METTTRDLKNRFDGAERRADAGTLQDLIADDFQSIGPKGFVLDKDAWIDRHTFFSYQSLDTREMDIRLYDNAAIVRNVQHNKATYKD